MANTNYITSSVQNGYGKSFIATGKFPIVAKRAWQTYADALEYAGDLADSCFAGVILAVINDDDAKKNGVYLVESCPTLQNPDAEVILTKVGDGAGAAVVTEGDELKAIRLTTSSLTDVLYYQRRLEPTPYIDKDESYEPLVMRGREVFKHAVTNSCRDIRKLLNQTGLDASDIKYYVLHQANRRIIDSIRNFLDVEEEKVPHNVERYGNISSAALPALLDELNRAGKLQKGDKLVFSAFGAGFTTGACVIEWAK